MTSLTWSALAFLLSALAWILGDALIVGFHKPDRRRYGEFIELMGDDAYAFYTRVNEPRLRWGALVANYAAPLMLAGLYAHWALLHHSTIGVVAVVLLGMGLSLAPLALRPAWAHGRAHAPSGPSGSTLTMATGLVEAS